MTPHERSMLANSLRSRLRRRPACLLLQQIADEGGFSLSWLNSFAGGKFANPHVRYLRALDEALTKLTREIA